jgi:hypothetical protein
MSKSRSISLWNWLIPFALWAAPVGLAGCGIAEDAINCVFDCGIEFSGKVCSDGAKPTIDCDDSNDAQCICECSDGRSPCEELEDSASDATE